MGLLLINARKRGTSEIRCVTSFLRAQARPRDRSASSLRGITGFVVGETKMSRGDNWHVSQPSFAEIE